MNKFHRILATVLLITAGKAASAEKFECTFTEPFLSVTYDTSTQILKEVEQIERKTRIIRDVQFVVQSAGVFHLISRKGHALLTLNLTGRGGDSMYELVYPYEGFYKNAQWKNGVYGGCSSSVLPIQEEPKG